MENSKGSKLKINRRLRENLVKKILVRKKCLRGRREIQQSLIMIRPWNKKREQENKKTNENKRKNVNEGEATGM
jgi:hypothetical protein